MKGRLDVCLQQILPRWARGETLTTLQRPPFFTAITFYFAELPKAGSI